MDITIHFDLAEVLAGLTQGDRIMASIAQLQDTVNQLQASATAREARDVAQDAVTTAQITQLNDNVVALQAVIAAGGLSTADATAVDGIITSVQAVIASLDAADPTLPVVV